MNPRDNNLTVPIASAVFAFALLMLTANNYGIFTDELYFVACAQHIGFGYVDQPPLVAWMTSFSMVFGRSPFVLRIFRALAFSGTLVLAVRALRSWHLTLRLTTLHEPTA